MELTAGYLRVAASAPEVAIADPERNAERIVAAFERASADSAALLLLPELALTGYSCEDLFASSTLLSANHRALAHLVRATRQRRTVLVVGAPWLLEDGRLLNCAFVIARGSVCGAVPKSALPNQGEYYEKRWFVSGDGVQQTVVDPKLGRFDMDVRQIFRIAHARFGVEVCEDLWSPRPTGVEAALAGATLIVNPSASNELVAKADYRRSLVAMASAQRICGYLYASCGPAESTKDVVFGGHLLAAENGIVIAESERFVLQGVTLTTEIDVDKLQHDRIANQTFASARRAEDYRVNDALDAVTPIATLTRRYVRHPFVPDDERELNARAREILSIQATGLARRQRSVNGARLVLGLSGGLDSTLAFLVALDALALGRFATERLHALTMPGPGTSAHTLESARALAAAGGVTLREIPITTAVTQHLNDLGHDRETHDVVFENAQARERTQILFDYANKVNGIVVGTGDLSELALGWCTYNADHMASYNVNAGVPKTLVKYLVRWYMRHRAKDELVRVLERVLATPISPELLPPSATDGISQHTESLIGPYELHDFFLYHHLRNGFGPQKIYRLACDAFAPDYDGATIKRWLRVFVTRFFAQQFKRTTLPPGPKVGTISLSPRGDWRMPDEASAGAWLAALDAIET
jgi:NAD+ synthase (glutamine-hydrolysing)